MGKIKLDRDEMKKNANKIGDFKKNINSVLRQTDETERVLNSIEKINTYQGKKLLTEIQDLAYEIARDLNSLHDNFNYAIKDYDRAENDINRLIKSLEKESFNMGSKFNPSKYLKTKGFNSLGFVFEEKNGKIYIKVKNNSFNNSTDFLVLRNEFTEYLGGTSKWDRSMLEKLTSEEGLELFNYVNKDSYDQFLNKFKNSKFAGLESAIDDIGTGIKNGKLARSWSVGSKEFKSSFNVLDDFNFSSWQNVSKATKASKALGAAGNVISVFENGKKNLMKDGEWDINGETVTNFAVDTTIDITSGAGMAAAGAFVGSFILPPVGTVVGAVVGVGLSVVANCAEFGDPKKSLVDHTKDFANEAVDNVVEGIGDICDSIGNKFDEIFW